MQARAGRVSWRSYVGLPHPVRAAPSHRVSSLLGWLFVRRVGGQRALLHDQFSPGTARSIQSVRYQAKEREKCGSERINNGQVFARHSGYAMLSFMPASVCRVARIFCRSFGTQGGARERGTSPRPSSGSNSFALGSVVQTEHTCTIS